MWWSPKNFENDIETLIRIAISKKNNTSSIIKLAHSDLKTESFSHILAFPILTDYDFKNYEYRIASFYIIQKLSDKFDKNILVKQANLIETGR